VSGTPARISAVLFDRDDTLVEDIPYNGDPDLVTPLPGARQALAAVRRAGLFTGVVTNQSGLARGLLTWEQVRAVNARVDRLLGPFDVWEVCPHAPEDVCGCRKPAPGLVLRAAHALRVPPAECAVIGDIGCDVEAAAAAGAFGVLVPTSRTRRAEVEAAARVAENLADAVRRVLDAAEVPA
jgi:D-glycero-D-manno-heptose 1,7-bisphosphate phosphatase